MAQLPYLVAPPTFEGSPSLSLLETSPGPVWVLDEATLRFLGVNDPALRFLGYGRDQFLAMTLAELRLDPGAPQPVGALTEGEPCRSRLRRADGSVLDVELAAKSIDYAGRPAWVVAATDIGGRIQTERALAETSRREKRLRQLFEAASDWFWETDADNRLIYLSPNVEAVLGLPVSAYLGKRVADTEGIVIEPEAGRASLAAIRARKPYRSLVYCRKTASGKVVWINSEGVPNYDEDGGFLGYRGIARDITAQFEAERALRASEQRFRELFEIAADHYWEADTRYRVSYVSPNFESVTGIPPAEILGRSLSENPHVAITPEVGRMVLGAYKARQPYRDFVYSYEFEDGTKRWISLNGVPVFGEDGSLIKYRGVGADITHRVEAEQAARLAQRRLHDAVSYVTQPFVVYDMENRVVAFNQAFTDLHRVSGVNTPVCEGVGFEELIAWQRRFDFYAPDSDEAAVTPAALLEAFQDGQEHTYHLGDGRWMLVMYRRLPGGGRVGLWTDVTAIKRAEAERRILEQQLHHSQRLEALGTLAGGVAHELNNALTPVIALTTLVARKLPEGSRERGNLDTVVGAAQRSRALVEQILSFSRNESGRRRDDVDLAEVLRDALCLLRATVPTSIRIEQTIAPTPLLEADPGQLQQVIVNLVNNAAQAVGEAMGTIAIRLEPTLDGAHLCLSVSDTGCGMDAATKARVFEPFFTTREVGKGTGLGLAVVHGIIKNHGGRIEVESAPGEGTRFDVILPTLAVAAVHEPGRNGN
jgi:PAS domain S-box-containing protein